MYANRQIAELAYFASFIREGALLVFARQTPLATSYKRAGVQRALASHALRVIFAGRPRPERLTARFGRQNGVFESERPEAQQLHF